MVMFAMRIVALAATPLLLILAQTPFEIGPLALVALVPWLVATERAARALGAAALGFCAGTLYASVGAAWISEALRSFGAARTPAALGLLVTAAWTQGLPFAVIGAALHGMRKHSAAASVGVAAVLFFVVETLQSRFALGLPLGLLGHTQVAVPGVAQLAVAGGVPFVSALLAAVNQAIARAIAPCDDSVTRWRLVGSLVAAWLSLAVLGVPLTKVIRDEAASSSGSTLRLLLVQPEIPRGHRWAPDLQIHHLERVAAYTEEAVREERAHGVQPDAVLWPENLVTRPLDDEMAALLRAKVQRVGVPVIAGLVRPPLHPDPNLYRSSVVWLGPTGDLVDAVDKQLAIPLLESSSRGSGSSWLAFAFGAAARDGLRVEEARDGRPLRGDFSAAPVLCFEALFPALVAARRDAETRMILNLVDDGWVPGDTATRQLTAAVRFRAIEQRLPLVRVAHGGLSAAFDPLGRSILELPLHAEAHAIVELRPSAPPTILERGSLLALPLTAFGVVWCATGVLQRSRRARATGGIS